LTVIMAMPLSFVSCTKSDIKRTLSLKDFNYALFAETFPASITLEAMRSR
jgi:hypothetical protein